MHLNLPVMAEFADKQLVVIHEPALTLSQKQQANKNGKGTEHNCILVRAR